MNFFLSCVVFYSRASGRFAVTTVIEGYWSGDVSVCIRCFPVARKSRVPVVSFVYAVRAFVYFKNFHILRSVACVMVAKFRMFSKFIACRTFICQPYSWIIFRVIPPVRTIILCCKFFTCCSFDFVTEFDR